MLHIPRFDEEFEAGDNLVNPRCGKSPNPFNQIRFVYSYNLRYVDHAVFFQVRFSFIEKDITRHGRTLQIGCQRAYDNGIDSAVIKHVILHNNVRMPVTRF